MKPLYLFPILTLLGLSITTPTYQEASAINNEYHYVISDKDETKSFYNSSISNVGTKDFVSSQSYSFIESNNDTFLIKNNENDKYLCVLGNSLKFYTLSNASSYSYETRWVHIYEDGHHQLKSYDSIYYLCFTGNTFTSLQLNDSNRDQSYLSIFSYEEDAYNYIESMKDIKCIDYINGPSLEDWNNSKTQYDLLKTPTKNYLKSLVSNKDASVNSIEGALAKYDYIISKYNKVTEKYNPYISNRVINRSIIVDNPISSSGNPVVLASIVIVITTIAMVGFGVMKRRR